MKLYAPDIILVDNDRNNHVIIADSHNTFFRFRYDVIRMGKIKETAIGYQSRERVVFGKKNFIPPHMRTLLVGGSFRASPSMNDNPFFFVDS